MVCDYQRPERCRAGETPPRDNVRPRRRHRQGPPDDSTQQRVQFGKFTECYEKDLATNITFLGMEYPVGGSLIKRQVGHKAKEVLRRFRCITVAGGIAEARKIARRAWPRRSVGVVGAESVGAGRDGLHGRRGHDLRSPARTIASAHRGRARGLGEQRTSSTNISAAGVHRRMPLSSTPGLRSGDRRGDAHACWALGHESDYCNVVSMYAGVLHDFGS